MDDDVLDLLAIIIDDNNEEDALDMLQSDPSLDVNGINGDTLLKAAAAQGFVKLTRRLIARGANLEGLSSSGGPRPTPLMQACANGHLDMVTCLLAKGASATTVAQDGITALHQAARCGQTSIIDALIAAGAPVNALAHPVGTPLHLAVWNEHGCAVLALIQHGASLDALDAKGNTPLNVAMNDRPSLVRLLVEHEQDLLKQTLSKVASDADVVPRDKPRL